MHHSLHLYHLWLSVKNPSAITNLPVLASISKTRGSKSIDDRLPSKHRLLSGQLTHFYHYRPSRFTMRRSAHQVTASRKRRRRSTYHHGISLLCPLITRINLCWRVDSDHHWLHLGHRSRFDEIRFWFRGVDNSREMFASIAGDLWSLWSKGRSSLVHLVVFLVVFR